MVEFYSFGRDFFREYRDANRAFEKVLMKLSKKGRRFKIQEKTSDSLFVRSAISYPKISCKFIKRLSALDSNNWDGKHVYLDCSSSFRGQFYTSFWDAREALFRESKELKKSYCRYGYSSLVMDDDISLDNPEKCFDGEWVLRLARVYKEEKEPIPEGVKRITLR